MKPLTETNDKNCFRNRSFQRRVRTVNPSPTLLPRRTLVSAFRATRTIYLLARSLSSSHYSPFGSRCLSLFRGHEGTCCTVGNARRKTLATSRLLTRSLLRLLFSLLRRRRRRSRSSSMYTLCPTPLLFFSFFRAHSPSGYLLSISSI